MEPKQRLTLAGVVILHLIVTAFHGSAHNGAAVEQGWAAMAFIFLVIIAAPLVGVGWMWLDPRTGARIIGIAMAASLLFGLVNHFIIPGADHVNHVAPAWRGLFASTAVMLVIIEAAGAALGFAYGRSVERRLA
ncbi:MAG TPA: hypothetical protein VH436_06110 [Vicinamibacterales bacterium]|jgi:hypothetical protein